MNKKGFSQVILLAIIAVLILAGAGGFLVLREKKMPSSEKTGESPSSTVTTFQFIQADFIDLSVIIASVVYNAEPVKDIQ